MAVLPVGTLTLFLTDLEGSTRTWETRTRAMREAMAEHDRIVYSAVERDRGTMVESGRAGDSIFAVFSAANDAASCALDVQRSFRAAPWPEGLSLRIRISLHTGEVELRDGHYFGPPINRCARVLALCHGGQTLVTQATHELLVEDPPVGVELTDLGLHRLKDLRRSERIYQLTDVSDPERFPPLSATPAYRSNLPVLLTSFVGRDRELAELRALQRASRLLTLTGAGGAGKTRLAQQLAREVAAELAGGAWLVELASASDPSLVAPAVAGALDVEPQQGRALIETLADRCAAAPMLLVLDNCEHLLGECARVAETLLRSCPDLRILATSREPLNVGGEVTWRVPALARSEAMRLFTERARSRVPQFAPVEGSTGTIADICDRLDGIPLAIELAAARVATLPLEEIRRRLGDDLSLLTGGSRTAARRQQTLEAAIDWSHDLLPELERVLFRRISVFAGGFTLAAVETVCADGIPPGSIVDHLGQLVSKSLVRPLGDRYACLVTIRSYARARLAASGEIDAVRRAHALYFLGVAESRRPGALAIWLDRCEQDHDDLREALTWSIGAEPPLAARLAGALYDFWLLRGHAIEARSSLERIHASLPADSPERPRILLESAVFAYTAGDFAAASRLVDEGSALARTTQDHDLISRALLFQGNVALASGAADVTQVALEESLAIARRMKDRRREAEALHHLGSLAIVRDDPELALTRFTESLELKRAMGIADETATTLTLRAFVRMLRSDPRSARVDILEALRIALALRDRRAAWSLDVLACLTALDGDAVRALRLAGAASAAFDTTGQHPPAVWRGLVGPIIERARVKLGQDAADAAWSEGRLLDFDRSLHYALATIDARDDQLILEV